MPKTARDSYILIEKKVGANPTMEVVGNTRKEIVEMLADILSEDASQGYELTNIIQDAITKSKKLIYERSREDIDYLMKIPQAIKN